MTDGDAMRDAAADPAEDVEVVDDFRRARTTVWWIACSTWWASIGGVDATTVPPRRPEVLGNAPCPPSTRSVRPASPASNGSREQRDAGAFVTLTEYRRGVLGARRRRRGASMNPTP